MGTPRPKTFRAARDFRLAGASFATGDVVPSGQALAVALKYGDHFVVADATRQKPDQTTSNEEAV